MKTLKELLVYQDYNSNIQDIEIIKMWFIDNNQEQQGIELITALAKSQTEKLQKQLDFARSWGLSLVDMKDCVKDKEVAKNLNLLMRCCTLSYPLESVSWLYEWAKQNIPKMKIPKLFFMPTVAYLQQYGINFNDE